MAIQIPHGRGFRQKCDPSNGKVVNVSQATDMFLHAIFGRIAGNDNSTYELNTYYDNTTNTIELCVPDKYLKVIEDIEQGDNFKRYIRWLCQNAGGSAIVAYNKVDSTTVLDDTYSIVEIDASGGPFTIFLPSASGREGKAYNFKKTDITNNAATISPIGADKIDGQNNYLIHLENEFAMVASNGTGWLVLNQTTWR